MARKIDADQRASINRAFEARDGLRYRHLRAWCQMMGSYPYYVKQELDHARQTNAPDDAIYWREDSGWRTFADVTNANTREVIEAILADMGGRK
jgi:hypothetical protein